MSSDREAIIAVTHAYCWALDTRSWDDLDQVFVPDARARLGGEQRGLEAIKARVSDVLSRLEMSQHIVSTHDVTVAGDRAVCRCYLIAQHVRTTAGAERRFTVGGAYDDELVRTPVGWRIASRTLTVLWTDGDPATLDP